MAARDEAVPGTLGVRRCLLCHTTQNLARHHVFEGCNRQKSEMYGMVVWLCEKHHTGDEGIHRDGAANLQLKQAVQAYFERTHTREEFMQIFKRSYL